MNKPWWKASDPKEVRAMPWLHPDAIKYLEELLRPDFNVVEHGCGGSTLWFASRVVCIKSYESNIDWANAINNAHLLNVMVLSGNPTGAQIKYDLMLIDGEPVEDRAKWLFSALGIVKSGGYVVLDNANRPEYAGERVGLAQYADLIHTVNGNEPNTKYLVTEFWQMK